MPERILIIVFQFVSFLLTAGCRTRDASQGWFKLVASGGIEAAIHGRAMAYESTDLSGLGYVIALDIAHASPPIKGFTDLVISTAVHPDGEVRFVHSSTAPNNTNKTSWVTLDTPSGADSEWSTDSGTVDFKNASGPHAVAGEFTVHLSCERCGPEHMGSHAVLQGSFETRH
jgi:hypothetical protein